MEPEKLDQLGPIIGRGAVWLNDEVASNKPSDPFLLSGFQKHTVHLITDAKTTITFELDVKGNGEWMKLIEIQTYGYLWYELDKSLDATWVRLRSSKPLSNATPRGLTSQAMMTDLPLHLSLSSQASQNREKSSSPVALSDRKLITSAHFNSQQ